MFQYRFRRQAIQNAMYGQASRGGSPGIGQVHGLCSRVTVGPRLADSPYRYLAGGLRTAVFLAPGGRGRGSHSLTTPAGRPRRLCWGSRAVFLRRPAEGGDGERTPFFDLSRVTRPADRGAWR